MCRVNASTFGPSSVTMNLMRWLISDEMKAQSRCSSERLGSERVASSSPAEERDDGLPWVFSDLVSAQACNESAGPRKVLLIKRRACHMAATDHRFKRLVDLSELRGAPSGKKRVPTIPGAGLGLIPLVETLTLSRTKTQVNPPVAVPDIAKADA